MEPSLCPPILSVLKCAYPHTYIHSRQKSISRLGYFCREPCLGSVGRVPAFSSVSSGRHCTATVIQTHLFPPSPAPHPFYATPWSHCQRSLSFSVSLSLSVFLLHTQEVICFSTGSKPQCQVKASIGRIKRVAGVRSQGPTLPSKP